MPAGMTLTVGHGCRATTMFVRGTQHTTRRTIVSTSRKPAAVATSVSSELLHHSQYAAEKTSEGPRPVTALFFPGQGVQKVGMLTPFIRAFPKTVLPMLEEIDSALGLNPPLSKVIAEGPASVLTGCENSQPAIFITSTIIHKVLEKEFGFNTHNEVDYMLGHSLGEFAALVAAGCLKLPDAVQLVRKRAEVMAKCTLRAEMGEAPPDPFATSYHNPIDETTAAKSTLGMVALLSPPSHQPSLIVTIKQLLSLPPKTSPIPEGNIVQLGNINSSSQIVLSGHLAGINALLSHLRQWGGHDPHAVRLNIASPFHTTIMLPAEELMKAMLAPEHMITFPGTTPVISNLSGREFGSAAEIRELLSRQATEMVNWAGSIQYLKNVKKCTRYIALGPGRVGAKLVSAEVENSGQVLHVASPVDCEVVMRKLEKEHRVAV